MRNIGFLLSGLSLLSSPALGADAGKPVPVVFAFASDDWQLKNLLQATREQLSGTPSFNLMAVVTPDTLVIRIPGGIKLNGHQELAAFEFTAAFFRNGDKIGESYETCPATKFLDCATQLAADAASAAGIAK